jgi:hypothetical protein
MTTFYIAFHQPYLSMTLTKTQLSYQLMSINVIKDHQIHRTDGNTVKEKQQNLTRRKDRTRKIYVNRL